MPAPDLVLVKTWCRIDGAEFDAIMPTMIASATSLASHECGVDYATEAMPEAVQQWCAAQVAYWINNPEAATEKALTQSPFISGLLDPFRQYNWTPAA